MKYNRLAKLLISSIITMLMMLLNISIGFAEEPDVIARIQKAGVLRVGVAPDPPNLYQDAKTGQWHGIFLDFANYWAKDVLHVKLEVDSGTWGSMIAGLQAGRYDLALDLNQVPSRALAVNFTNGLVFDIAGVAFYPKRTHVHSWSELNNSKYKICDAKGSAEDIGLMGIHPKAKIIRLPTDIACQAALASGRVDGDFDDWYPLAHFARANDGVRLLFPKKPIVEEPQAMALIKGSTFGDIQAINIAISHFKTSGDLAASMSAHKVANPLKYVLGHKLPSYVESIGSREF